MDINNKFISEKCRDINVNCRAWRSKDWFAEFCTGEKKDQKHFGGETLMHSCQRSCGGCNEGHGMSG